MQYDKTRLLKRNQCLKFPDNMISVINDAWAKAFNSDTINCNEIPGDFIETMMNQLPERDQSFLIQFYKEGKPAEEIGKSVDMTRSRIIQLIHKAEARLYYIMRYVLENGVNYKSFISVFSLNLKREIALTRVKMFDAAKLASLSHEEITAIQGLGTRCAEEIENHPTIKALRKEIPLTALPGYFFENENECEAAKQSGLFTAGDAAQKTLEELLAVKGLRHDSAFALYNNKLIVTLRESA